MATKKARLILGRFIKELDYSTHLVCLVNDVRQAYQPPRGPKLAVKEVELIAEFSFLNVFVCYEVFMENIFLCYMLGGEASNHYKPKRYVFPRDEEHARRITLQDHTSYTDWASPDKVTRRAEYCFKDGAPFKEGISLYVQILQDIKTIRNHIAHSSIDAKDKFEALTRKYLGTLPIGSELKAGAFLLLNNQQNLTPQDFMTFFCEELKNFGRRIVP